MHILDIPFDRLPAPSADRRERNNLPALPHGELESLTSSSRASTFCVQQENVVVLDLQEEADDGCTYENSEGRPCGRPRIHYSEEAEPEKYCASHFAWVEQVESENDLPYPDSRQALLDLLAHTTAQVLAGEMMSSKALVIMHLARAIERQLHWL